MEKARWIEDKKLKEEYNRYMEMDGNWQELWKDAKEGNSAVGIQEKKEFFYTYRRTRGNANGGWRLIIPRNLNLRGMSAIEFLIQEAHDQTDHGGLGKTYSYLHDKYSWINQYQDTKEYIASCNICQLSKGTTQLPVGLLTPLAVPQKPWTTVSTDFLSLEPVTVFLSDILLGYGPERGTSSPEVTFHKLLVI